MLFILIRWDCKMNHKHYVIVISKQYTCNNERWQVERIFKTLKPKFSRCYNERELQKFLTKTLESRNNFNENLSMQWKKKKCFKFESAIEQKIRKHLGRMGLVVFVAFLNCVCKDCSNRKRS